MIDNTNENCNKVNSSLSTTNTYDFAKNTFVVEPVFKKENAETLGSILLRLMTHAEYNKKTG